LRCGVAGSGYKDEGVMSCTKMQTGRLEGLYVRGSREIFSLFQRRKQSVEAMRPFMIERTDGIRRKGRRKLKFGWGLR